MRTDYSPEIPWALATLQTEKGPRACIETAQGLYDLAATLEQAGHHATDVMGLFSDWESNEQRLNQLALQLNEDHRIPDSIRLAPLLYPGKVLCAGANYYKHLAEMGVTELSKESQRLFFFFKPAQNAVVGEGPTVHMPLDTQEMDWEIELAVVISKPARAVSIEEAMDYVAGYMVSIDACARDLNRAPDTFYKLDWVAGKAQESCCPLGPRFIPASAIHNPAELHLTLAVNGVTKQDDFASDMIFSISEQIAAASRIMQLDAGDVLLTGTPAGVGVPRKEFLHVGDRITATISSIGKLDVVIQAPSTEVRSPIKNSAYTN